MSQLSQVTDSESLDLYIKSQGLDNAGNRTRVLDDLYSLVEQDPEQGVRLYNLFMESPSEQNPKKSRSEYWNSGSNVAVKSQLRKIQDLIHVNQDKDELRRKKDQAMAYQARVQQIRELNESIEGGINRTEWQNLDKSLRSSEYGESAVGLPPSMQGYLDGSDVDTQAQIDSIKLRVLKGEAVDLSVLDEARFKKMSPEDRSSLTQLLTPMAQGGTQIDRQTITSIRTGLKGDLKDLLGETGNREISSDVAQMTEIGFDWFMDGYQRRINAGSDAAKALEDQWGQLRKEISEARGQGKPGNDYDGIFALKVDPISGKPNLGHRGGFQRLALKPNGDDDNMYGVEVVAGLLQANPYHLSDGPAFGDIEDSSSWAAQITSPTFELKRRPPNWLVQLDKRDTNHTWQEIVNKQREFYGFDPIDFGRGVIPKEIVRPEVQSLLTFKPNAATEARALTTTYAATNPAQRYKPVLDLISSEESNNDTRHGGYDAMNLGGNGTYVVGTTTGTDHFGTKLEDYSVNEILQLQASGRVNAVGRYQFIHSTLKEQVRRQAIDPNQKFDRATQDKLAIGYFNESIGTFRANGRDVIEGLGQRWHGLQKVSRSRMQKI